MFSEYASRFLSQSQSHIAPDMDSSQRNVPECGRRSDRPASSRVPSSKSYLHRALRNPYNRSSSQSSQFLFSTRGSASQAPLFHSTHEHFREEDEEREHVRETADLYALRKSRQNFGDSRLKDSSEAEAEGDADSSRHSEEHNSDEFATAGSIRDSWGWKSSASGGPHQKNQGAIRDSQRKSKNNARSRSRSSLGKDKMVDVRLEDSVRDDEVDDKSEGDVQHSEFIGVTSDPPERKSRKSPHQDTSDDHFERSAGFGPHENEAQNLINNQLPPPSPAESNIIQEQEPAYDETPLMSESHDVFWGQIFLLSVCSILATSFLVYLNTSVPSRSPILGDTIYSTLHASFGLLGAYTLVSIFVSLLWLALLRSYVRPLVYGMIVAVPVILFSFSLYPFISSFKGTWHGNSIQDKIMRWGSLIPSLIAVLWIYSVYKGRHSAGKAIGILEFSCKILAANPALLILGFATIAVTAIWTWVWLLMFTRVFLGGHVNSGSNSIFIIDMGSWWLGIYFIIVYLWSLGVISGIQRTTTAATVSQWYFHRLATPSPSSLEINQAALMHSITTLFGTICLSTLLALLIRLPLIVLPRRLSSLLALAAYSFVPTPITSITNPLTLSYAAIHSNPLHSSARSLSQMPFLAPTTTAGTAIHPRAFSDTYRTDYYSYSLLPYRLSKLLLHATRFMMSLALGFGGWVSTARGLQVPINGGDKGSTVRGSLYAYVVGLIAGVIGWSVLSAMEGVLACVVDAAVVCWASEVGSTGREARYCREAGWLFGGESAMQPRERGGEERLRQMA